MPNAIALAALAIWPFVMFGLFRTLTPSRAFLCSLIGAYLLLPPAPAGFDFPLLPPFTKTTLPHVTLVVIFAFFMKEKIEILPRSVMGKILMLVFVLSPTFTVITNPEPIFFATGGLRGLYAMDIVSQGVAQMMSIIGFVMARNLLGSRDGVRELLIALVIAGCIYGWPMLLEVRLSPQLNLWVYGYYQHLFEQSIRAGGFRPLVFLSHGIWAAMFAMMSLAAALILWKNERGVLRQYLTIAVVFLGAVLVLAKTLSPLVYLVVLVTCLFLTSWRVQLRAAVVLAALSIAYPLLKGADLVPEERLLAAASEVSEERSNSLRFRLDNEAILLDRAKEKPLFGWGIWGRNHVHDSFSGEILTVTDGRWIITIGVFGWIGFLAEFGLLALPIFLLSIETGKLYRQQENLKFRNAVRTVNYTNVKKRATEENFYRPTPLIGGAALLLALNMVDLLPNATLTPMTWILAGGLLGYAERLAERREDEFKTNNHRKPSPLDPTPRLRT